MIKKDSSDQTKDRIITFLVLYLLIGIFITIVHDAAKNSILTTVSSSGFRCLGNPDDTLWCRSIPMYYLQRFTGLRFWTDALFWPVWFLEIFRKFACIAFQQNQIPYNFCR